MRAKSLQQALQERQQQGLYRSHRVCESPQGSVLRYQDRQYLNFCSNDYLGLANHPKLIEALKTAADRWGVGAGSAHLVCGHQQVHEQLQNALAEFTQRPAVLLFSTGYMANLSVIHTLVGRGDNVYADRLNHASLIDGAKLSGAQMQRYRHQDLEHLNQLLSERQQRNKPNNALIVTDGVFSMDGDLAPLPDLARLALQYHACLMVDDAHGIGVLGATGGGLLQQFQLDENQVPILMGTFGKALGCFGAFVAASKEFIEALIQFARPYIYTTALPAVIAHTVLTSLELVRSEHWRRYHLQKLIKHFQAGISQLGLPVANTPTPIQPLFLGSAQQATRWSQALWDRGIYISAIRPPTVPKNQARLRISITAEHRQQDIDRLILELSQLKNRFGMMGDDNIST